LVAPLTRTAGTNPRGVDIISSAVVDDRSPSARRALATFKLAAFVHPIEPAT
jgi:hypothetical protein